jgi:type IV pilus assembly protein PilY1
MASPAFDLVVLNPVNVTVSVVMNGATSTNLASIGHPYYDESAGAINYKVRTAHEEITNYANWAAYYRNRTAATKTAAALAFNDVINSTPPPPVIPKVTFTTIQYTGGTSPDLPVPADYSSAFLNRIYSYTANFSTPLRTALRAVGEKFKTNSGGNYIKYACQRSAVIMFTDGLWNDSWTGVGNIDGSTIGNLPDYGDWGPDGKRDKSKWANFKTVYGGGSLGGDSGASTNWPNPIRDHKSASNTLADIALYYWKTRLGGFITNEVVPTNRDPAVWPHLNFYGMGFGVKGTLPSNDQAATLANMKDGTGGSFVWPAPAGNFTTTVDDLWHASINGFGRYVAATSPDEFRAGLKSILAEILNLGGANSGVGFTRTDLTVGAQYTYTPSFSPGWGGDIVKKSIDNLGQEHSIIGQKSAADSLAELLTPTPPPPPGVLPWRDRRQVFTTVWSGGKIGSGLATPVPFAASGAFGGSSQIATLGTTAALRANAIAYLRGDRSNEGDGLGKFRIRGTGPLGDIVDAAPVAVTTPFCDAAGIKCSYDESLNPGYQQFYQDKKNRDPMVYVAANDGMLHAFDGNLKEQWAYIPSDLFRPHNKAGIVNLTFQESNPDTPFYHYHYVNATPRILDVFSSTDNKWKTVLVGGLGKGGTSYYALDVTDAGALALEDATASSKVKWEFTDDNMGYTYGRAILVKTRAESWGYKSDNDPDGKWVAILPSGYNNGSGNGQPKSGDGRGYLFFVDLDTGALLHKVSTPDGFGSGSEPLGIAYIGGYVEDYRNQLVTAIYAGDQQGNFWRFNLEDTDHNNWKAERMAIIKNGSSTPYVTTEPWVQLAKRDNHGDWERWVFVGTGGFRNDDDLTATIPLNTFYAFRDGTRGYADTFIDKLRNDLASVTGVNSVAAADKDNLDNNGWYEDVGVGYHLDVRPMAAYGRVVYAANKFVGGLPGGYVGPEPCSSAVFLGRVYARDIISTNTIFASGYVEFPEGVADITLVKKKKSGSDELAIAVTGKGGGGIDPNIPSLIGSDGEGVATGVPVITSIRYISD